MPKAAICTNCGSNTARSKYCPECGTPVETGEVPPPDSLDAGKASEPGSPDPHPTTKRRRWATAAAGAVAAVALVAGAVGIGYGVHATSEQRTLATRVGHLNSQVQALHTALRSTAASSTISGLNSSMKKVTQTIAQYRNCLPELQTEIDGLSIGYSINNNDPSKDSFSVTNGAQISNDCNAVLYGTGN